MGRQTHLTGWVDVASVWRWDGGRAERTRAAHDGSRPARFCSQRWGRADLHVAGSHGLDGDIGEWAVVVNDVRHGRRQSQGKARLRFRAHVRFQVLHLAALAPCSARPRACRPQPSNGCPGWATAVLCCAVLQLHERRAGWPLRPPSRATGPHGVTWASAAVLCRQFHHCSRQSRQCARGSAGFP